MDFKNKADLRAFLESAVESAPEASTLRGIRPPSAADYVQALRTIESKISPAQRDMLIGHAQAPTQTLTMTQLARLAGRDTHNDANRDYGRLGRILIEALGIPSPKYKVYAIAGFDDDPESGESRAHMYPELRAALVQLGWVTTEDVKQTAAGPSLSKPREVSLPAVKASGAAMLSIHEVLTVLEHHGFTRPEQSGLKVIRLQHPKLAEPLYVKQSSSIHARLQAPLVLHPDYEGRLPGLLAITGVERGLARYYHNSNLRGFPKRRNGGATDIAYGVDLGFRHMPALEQLLASLLGGEAVTEEAVAIQPGSSSADDIDLSDLALTDTEREALIKARIGQSGYRDDLLAYWGGCAVTDCSVPALLRASHIKPWRSASPAERLDPFNGLLLTPNLDLAFDQGLISFDDTGRILLGSDLDPASAKSLNITPELRLRQIEPRHRAYLGWHREHLFRK